MSCICNNCIHKNVCEWCCFDLDGFTKCSDYIGERPQGEWEDYSVNFWKCPECGYLLNKYCPQCYNKVILPKGGT